jgi:hypothetical protein
MKPKLKHLRHPLRLANIAKSLIATRWKMWRFVNGGERRFAGDSRLNLRSTKDGFASRSDGRSVEAGLLERICNSYIKAANRELLASTTYKPTEWWEQHRKTSLKPVIQALMCGDIEALNGMYRHFYRDPCSAGLIADQGIARNCFEDAGDFYRRVYLIDALYRLDYWKAWAGEAFTLSDLSGPSVGDPFGVMNEDVLIRAGAEYQHYCAHRVSRLLDSHRGSPLGLKKGIVVEIGGGFGGMAYYLLRDRPGVTYIDFDVPESIALTSYFLLSAFPKLNGLLYGEEELTKEAISRADVVLMPVFELTTMPEKYAHVSFSSHAMSDLPGVALGNYLKHIASITRNYFLYIGNGSSGKTISELADRQDSQLRMAEMRSSGWHDHRIQGIDEVEFLYEVCGG